MGQEADEHFAEVVVTLSGEPGVRVGTGRHGFGSDALTVGGKVFAMVARGRVVLKLPRDRVAGLVEGGDGHPFETSQGRTAREWVALDERCDAGATVALAREAYRFVGGTATS